MTREIREVGLSDLHVQLRIMSRLMAAQLKTTTSQQELVRLLATTGATHGEIADVLDTTSATVATTIQRLRKKAKGRVKDDSPRLDEGPTITTDGDSDG